MTYKYLALICALALLAPITYYHNETFSVDRLEFSTTLAADDSRVFIENDYFGITLRLGQCAVRDAYRFCLEGINRSIDHFPYEVEITMDVENICDDCIALEYECERNDECASNYCVHGVCRNQPTWCGDDVCDPGEEETCPQDCPEEVQAEEDVAEEDTAEPEQVQVEEEATTEQQRSETEGEQEVMEEDAVAAADAEFEEEQRRLLRADREETIREATVRARDDMNWLGAAGIVVVGLFLLFLVFRKHRHATI